MAHLIGLSINSGDATKDWEREAEEAAQELEHFVDGASSSTPFKSSTIGSSSPIVAPDYPNLYWSRTHSSTNQHEKGALIHEIVDALPDTDMIHHLYEIFVTRCQGALGNVVHTQTFLKQADELCHYLDLKSREDTVSILLANVSLDRLACHLLAETLKVNSNGHITERSRSEFTKLSYTVHAVEIAKFARESIHLCTPFRRIKSQEEVNESMETRKLLNKSYEEFIHNLPSFFRLGSSVGLTSTDAMAAIPIHRWMLHQQLWSLFLRLNRASLSSQDSRASCQLLAQNIIGTQAQIQARCTVCGFLSISDTQVYSAAVVLLLDLLFSSNHGAGDRSSAQLVRSMMKEKVRQAIELLRSRSGTGDSPLPPKSQFEKSSASTQSSVLVLEALMNLEEESDPNGDENGAVTTEIRQNGAVINPGGRKSLKKQVTNILSNLRLSKQGVAEAATQSGQDASSAADESVSTRTGGSHDLDVLPVLSTDTDFDFSQFIDFPPSPQSFHENDQYEATGNTSDFASSVSFNGLPN
ncbi:uncharacterized protein KY384_000472 [Bacidia gigantensis]|uniref:uncharacterized protein n=1 Tax=Bacidia gigantensis TaxID=2732470 RepID=UPI001D03DE32|nr:uncharacterized protein KY384_000472 [Bacidia gigantensis]KAG8525712.1 hypothetical protein KY384_000472 [Bacidia gigantensis]